MTHDLVDKATALIDHLMTRFHETHRNDLPELVARVRALEALGVAQA
jgi:iron-sulfur cluster repair protein YtfE (RIC family)